MNFVELIIDEKYVLRMYREKMQETEFGDLYLKITLDEWNMHNKNIQEMYDLISQN